MATKGNILVGTIGQGVMMSADDGASWTRASVRQGMHSDAIVKALLADPWRPGVVYAGTDVGLYRSDDSGVQWRALDTPMSGAMVFSSAGEGAEPIPDPSPAPGPPLSVDGEALSNVPSSSPSGNPTVGTIDGRPSGAATTVNRSSAG